MSGVLLLATIVLFGASSAGLAVNTLIFGAVGIIVAIFLSQGILPLISLVLLWTARANKYFQTA